MSIDQGAVYAILSAAVFAGPYVLVRRATHQSEESFTALAITLLVGTPIFLAVMLLSGQSGHFLSFSGVQYAWLAAAGVMHFLVARYLYFLGVRLMGANPTAAIIRTSAIFAVVIGVLLLGETVSARQVSGAVVIMVGAVLSSVEMGQSKLQISGRGLLLGLGAGLCVAGSGALIRLVMETTDAVYAATFVSYLAAFVVIVALLLASPAQRRQLRGLKRYHVLILAATAVLLVVGHLFRFLAFRYSPISVAQPLMGTVVVFILFYSFIVNRRIDVFNWRVILGIALVLGGVFLVSG